MNGNKAAVKHKHPMVPKEKSMLFVQIVPFPEDETSGSHCIHICLVVSILVHSHVRLSFVHCSFVHSRVCQLLVVWTSLMAKNMLLFYVQLIYYKDTMNASSFSLGRHVQGNACARGRLHNPYIWEFWGTCQVGIGHTYEARGRFVS